MIQSLGKKLDSVDDGQKNSQARSCIVTLRWADRVSPGAGMSTRS